jgi:uncharacterized protein with NRDE domain
VTNYRQGTRESPAPRSRGLLVSEFLSQGVGAREHLGNIYRSADQYNGFNLLALDQGGLFYLSNREGRVRQLAAGVYGLSNHLLDTPWPKVVAGKSAFGALLSGNSSELIPKLFELLSDRRQPTADLLPATGIGEQWERLLSSAFIQSDHYGTRSSTVVLVGRDGSIAFVERSFNSEGATGVEARFEFQIETSQRV